MASSKAYLDFILEQLSELKEITHRAMMGEYIIYYGGRIVGGIYGLDIILMGTAWPGPEIGKRCADIIRDSAAAGHEIGFHAWDHQKSQSKIDRMSPDELNAELSRGIGKLEEIIGKFPLSSATPGWRTNDALLLKKDAYPFEFNSDCRGDGIFYPVVDGRKLKVLQIPVTMPTYDEALGRDGVTEANYNDRMIQLLRPGKLNVLTIHAEAEGGKCRQMFREFLARVQEEGWEVGPLGKVAAEGKATAPEGEIIQAPFPGREGWLACQKSTEEKA